MCRHIRGGEQSKASDAFFFSSRRRHTRFDCDWSSDVCSSDLDVNARVLPGEKLAPFPVGCRFARSEEHTSELQSQSNLVCRLLLEKKKKRYYRSRQSPCRRLRMD